MNMSMIEPSTHPKYFVCHWNGEHTLADPQPALVPEDIFDREIVLLEGEEGSEPSVREMIEYYYRQAFTPEQAGYHADSLIAKLLGKEPV